MMIAPARLASRMSLSVIAPTPRWMTLDLHFGGGQLLQRVGECFRRTALVGLDDDLQRAGCARPPSAP